MPKRYFILLAFICIPLCAICQGDKLDSLTLSVDFERASIQNILDHISSQTGVYFSYNSNLIQETQQFTLRLEDQSVRHVLQQLFVGMDISFKLVNNQIILFQQNEGPPTITYEVYGTVLDTYTNEPVFGVNVFIAGTLKGGSTNRDGKYQISGVEESSFDLVASHIAYDIEISKVSINEDSLRVNIDIELNPKINQLKELQVVSLKYKDWQKYYALFKQQFLGGTSNARKCEILNPEVLDFVTNPESNSIIVKAYQPLVIINTALGYELNYYLEYFEISKGNTRTTGVSNFKELSPKNDREMRRWEKNRSKSFKGSLTHFLRSLLNDRLEVEGYKIYIVNRLPFNSDQNAVRVSRSDILSKVSKDGSAYLKYDGYLKIVYSRETESAAYVDDQFKQAVLNDPSLRQYYMSNIRRVSLGKQTSYMKLNFPKAKISTRGFFPEQLAVTTFGYWSWERVAEYLPLEYVP